MSAELEKPRVGGAARGYSWPPFEPGNQAHLKHGSYVGAALLSESPEVAELVDWILDTQPVSHPCDLGAATRLALVYRRLKLSTKVLDEVDEQLADRPAAAFIDKATWLARVREDHARWLREAGRIEAELGRTPASRAKLGLHLALGQRAALTVVELHRRAAEEAADEAGEGAGSRTSGSSGQGSRSPASHRC
jgi:hypothetical protein